MEVQNVVNRDLDLLWPKFKVKVLKSLAGAASVYPDIAVFEAWRAPARQDKLYAQGRTEPGKVVTGAKGWQSAHQFGLAVDLALFSGGKWSWQYDPSKIAKYFQQEGLRWGGPKDGPHYDMMGGIPVAVAAALAKEQGVQRLWLEIAAGVKP